MTIINKIGIAAMSGLILIFVGCPGTGTQQQPAKAPGGIDDSRLVADWTQLAHAATAAGQWDQDQKKWKNLSLSALGGADVSNQHALPAFVPAFADCGNLDRGKGADQRVSEEVQKIVDILKQDKAGQGHRKIVLVGEPGVDVDVRVQALAWQISKGCRAIPEEMRDRPVIALDMTSIKNDVLAKRLPTIQYLDYIKQVFSNVVQRFSNRAIYYLNEFPVLADSSVSPEAVLQIFLEKDASVLIEATVSDFNRHFSNATKAAQVTRVDLRPLPSSLVLPGVSVIAQSASAASKAEIPTDVIEDIVRLSRAFLPGAGLLKQASIALNRVLSSLAGGGKATRAHAVDAIASLSAELQKAAIEKSDALNRATSLDTLDANVALIKRYYLDQHKQEKFAEAGKKAIEPVINAIKDTISRVETRLSAVEVKILATLESKILEVNAKIEKLGEGIDSRILALAKELYAHSLSVALHFEKLAAEQEKIKTEILGTIAQLQTSLLDTFNKKIDQLSEAQQKMFRELSSANESIAKSLVNLDAANQNQSAQIQQLIADQKILQATVKGLSDKIDEKTASFLVAISNTNVELAALNTKTSALSNEQQSLLTQLVSLQNQVATSILPKLQELSIAQKSAFGELQTGLAEMAQELKTAKSDILLKMASNYKELFDSIERAKSAAMADAAAKVAEVNTAFMREVSRLDANGVQLKGELNARIDEAVTSLNAALSQAQAQSKAETLAAVQKNAEALKVLTDKIGTLDDRASQAEKDLYARIANANKEISKTLGEALASDKKELHEAIASATSAHLDLVKNVATLKSDMAAQKADLIAEIGRAVTEASDKLSKAIASGRKEDVAELKTLQERLVALSQRMGAAENEIVQLKSKLGKEVEQLKSDVEAVHQKIGSNSQEAGSAVGTLAQTVEALKQQVQTLSETVSQQKVDLLAELKKQISQLTATLEHTYIDKTEALSNISVLASGLKQLESRIEGLGDGTSAEKQSTAAKIQELLAQQDALRLQVESLSKAHDSKGLHVSDVIARGLEALANRVNAVEAKSDAHQKLWDELSKTNKKLKEDLDSATDAASKGSLSAQKALSEIALLAKENAQLVQNLGSANANATQLRALVDKQADRLAYLYAILFDQPGILQFKEKNDFNREVTILANCKEETIVSAKQSLDPQHLVVECGINCLVIDHRFWFKADEPEDLTRKNQKSFEIKVKIPDSEFEAKVRCLAR